MKKIFTLICVGMLALTAMAQDRNNDDEVIKLDPRHSRYNAVEGELIVKFADNTVLNISTHADKSLRATGITAVDALLANYNGVKMDRLFPLSRQGKALRRAKSFNGADVVERDLSRLCHVKIVEGKPGEVHQLIAQLNTLPEVEFAEPNYRVSMLGTPATATLPALPPTTSPYFNTDAYIHEPMYAMQWGVEAVHLPQLWAADTVADTSRPIIAILDSGVDINHTDLSANIWTNPDEYADSYNHFYYEPAYGRYIYNGDSRDDDHNGFYNDLHGYDFVNYSGYMQDLNDHGTYCAGIAAAVGNNGSGIVGANPNALIMPITVLDGNGQGTVGAVLQGIRYAVNEGADVLCISFGTYAYSEALAQVLAEAYQSMVIVAAAGNDALPIDPRCGQNRLAQPLFPAAFGFVLGVQATSTTPCPTMHGQLACFSNYDCDGLIYSQYAAAQPYNYEVSAPGVNIVGTVPGGRHIGTDARQALPLDRDAVRRPCQRLAGVPQHRLYGSL